VVLPDRERDDGNEDYKQEPHLQVIFDRNALRL
jgi:hypothetical protein